MRASNKLLIYQKEAATTTTEAANIDAFRQPTTTTTTMSDLRCSSHDPNVFIAAPILVQLLLAIN